MKERIVIEKTKEFRPHPALREGVNCIDTKYCQYEQVPETWEELKNLCNENNLEILADIIYTNALSFHKNGDIKDDENSIVVVNRTPQQMWNIIKSLIGEE